MTGDQFWDCPNCGHIVDHERYDTCPNCGYDPDEKD